ncbi:MAG: protein kinase [Gemmatimonadota bacterium]|nr:MAG: protein kinase [Gemmatimonadota bacterium]
MNKPLDRLTASLADRYRIEREIGRGGMATVYLAHDIRHNRDVALKLLDPELAASVGHERFLREIEIAAKLTHPNILPLLDSGDVEGLLFYTMPYVEGESLRARLDRDEQLPMDEALQITSEVAAALTYAHGEQIIHRDIKPENILISSGHAVVADFGIAKAVTAAGGDALTETGLVVGTPAYMSPEQAGGDRRIDGRSDVYALACVFYHMVVGEPPFTGPSAQAVLARHAVDPVSPVSTVRSTVPVGVDVVLAKALAKVPADRYATAALFAEALSQASTVEVPIASRVRRASWSKWLMPLAGAAMVALALLGWWLSGGSSNRDIERIAVLPPVDLGRSADREPVMHGMYNTLLTELGQAGVTVIGGAQSMMRYQGSDMTVREIAEELAVDAVVEPSVFWVGDSVGIGVRLIDGDTEESLWSHSYDADARDVVTLYRQVTRAIAGEIQLALTPAAETRLASAREVDPEAHEAYLQGRFYSAKLTQWDLETAIDYFNLALEKDSNYAPAYAGLSWAWVASQQIGYVSPAEATPKAVAAAQRSLALDSLLPEGHHALATAQGWAGWDWDVAERGMRRAIELNPAYGDARADFSHTLLVLKRFDEAEAQIDSALASDPFSVKFQAFRGVIYQNSGRAAKAITEFEKVLRAVPNHPVPRTVLADIYHAEGIFGRAVDNIAAMYAAEGIEEFATALSQDYEAIGYVGAMKAAAERLAAMSETAFVPPIMIATLYSYAGDDESTLSWFEKGFAAREPNLPYIGVTPQFDHLHDRPRFQALLQGMRLPWALQR